MSWRMDDLARNPFGHDRDSVAIYIMIAFFSITPHIVRGRVRVEAVTIPYLQELKRVRHDVRRRLGNI